MSQDTAIRTTGRRWDFLEPAMHPNQARTDHGKLKAAAEGEYLLYPLGQILVEKNDGSNEWAKIGTSGYSGRPRILKYPVIVDDAGDWQIGNVWHTEGNEIHSGSVDFFYQGFFKTQDLVGSGGTNEVQTETLDAGVDGGTRTLSFMGYTTAPIAWNADNATIKAAILAAIPVIVSADLTLGGGYATAITYTFSGVWAGANVPLLVVDPALLTDDGAAPATTGSVIAETTPGAGLLTGIGRLIRGTSSSGIMELGAATPV